MENRLYIFPKNGTNYDQSPYTVTPVEAIRFAGARPDTDILRAIDLAHEAEKDLLDRYPQAHTQDILYHVLSVVWNAGRVEGIRAERKR